MSPLAVAMSWRQEGRYSLALAALAEAPEGPEREAEAARIEVRLGHAREALAAGRRAEALARAQGRGLGDALLALAEATLLGGDYAAARAAVEEALPLLAALEGERSLAYAMGLEARASVLAVAGAPEEALAPIARAVALVEVLRPPTWQRALVLHTLAEVQHRAGQYAEARASWTEVLALRRAALDPDHPETAAALDGLGLTLRRLGRPREAAAAHREAQAIYERRPGSAPALAACLHGLAQALHRCGDFRGARDTLKRAVDISIRVQGADHPDSWVSRFEYARFCVDCGDFDGFAEMETARSRLQALLGHDHPTVLAMGRHL